MINRIVRLSFDKTKVNEFVDLFNSTKMQIASFEGCKSLTLLKDFNEPNVFYTYSVWDSEEHLNKYRYSDFFKETWSKTKALFNAKPQVFSLIVEDIIK
ncbi:MAG: putative quinol monooxygenase [Bacteroidia bacterium]